MILIVSFPVNRFCITDATVYTVCFKCCSTTWQQSNLSSDSRIMATVDLIQLQQDIKFSYRLCYLEYFLNTTSVRTQILQTLNQFCYVDLQISFVLTVKNAQFLFNHFGILEGPLYKKETMSTSGLPRSKAVEFIYFKIRRQILHYFFETTN